MQAFARVHGRAADLSKPVRHHAGEKPRRISRFSAGLLLLAVVGLLVWNGSRITPADPTERLALNGNYGTHQTLPQKTFRIGAMNIQGGKGLDARRDLGRIAVCLQGLDLVGLNEVHGGGWCGLCQNQADKLGEQLYMQSLFAPTERRWWHNHFGNGVLTRVALKNVQRIPLAGTQDKKFRNLVLTSFRHQGQTIHVLTTHIDRVKDRTHQLQAAVSLFLSLAEPAILMGDLNTTEADPQIQRLLAVRGVHDAVAQANKNHVPEKRIDWIFTRGLRCVDAGYIPTIASNHPVVWAELEISLPTASDRQVAIRKIRSPKHGIR